MNLELLRTFLAVTQCGGVRRAAESLHLTQPAVSARLRELETRLETGLFERVGRRLVLTEAGRLLVAETPALLAAEDALLCRVREAGGMERGTLRLATIDAASVYVLPRIYLEFRAALPGVQLTVQVVDSRGVLAAVQSLAADLGVLALPASHPEVLTTPFFADELVCVAGPAHPLAGRPAVTLAEAVAHPLVLYARGSTTRAVVDAVFAEHGVDPNVAMETASPEAMKRLAEVGVGITLVPELLVRDDVAAGRLCHVRLLDARFTRLMATAVHRGRTLPAAAGQFLAILHRRYPPLDLPAAARHGRRGRESGAGPTASGGPRGRRSGRRHSRRSARLS